MRYMLLMTGTQAEWQALGALPREDLRAHLAFLRDSGLAAARVRGAGERAGAGRAGAGQVVRARGGLAPAVSGAPFAPAREFLGAYWIVDCDSPARATEIAAQLSAAPGRGGGALNRAVEVRPVMRLPGEDVTSAQTFSDPMSRGPAPRLRRPH